MSRVTVTRSLALFVALSAVVSILRALALNHDRMADIDIFHSDPLPDIVINIAVGTLSLLAAPFLALRWRVAWYAVLIASAVGLVDAVRLIIVSFGGPVHILLFVMRAAILYVLLLREVSIEFGVHRS